MSIIVDLNQVMLSNLHMQLGSHKGAPIEEAMFRHMVLNSLRSYKTKFSHEYGEMIIACDNKNYWRKQVFPYYKAHRKKLQEKSEINWTQVFQYIDKLKQELREYFPYRVIDIESAEADDIIAILSIDAFKAQEKVLILSADKDFVQLQFWGNVNQYDPIRKQWIREQHPDVYLIYHIIKGDAGDGIPNILSPDNCFVIGERQRRMTQKRLDHYSSTPPTLYDDVAQRGYARNRQLIDLTLVPLGIKEKVREQYISEANKGRGKLMNYFMANKLKHLLEHLSEF